MTMTQPNEGRRVSSKSPAFARSVEEVMSKETDKTWFKSFIKSWQLTLKRYSDHTWRLPWADRRRSRMTSGPRRRRRRSQKQPGKREPKREIYHRTFFCTKLELGGICSCQAKLRTIYPITLKKLQHIGWRKASSNDFLKQFGLT